MEKLSARSREAGAEQEWDETYRTLEHRMGRDWYLFFSGLRGSAARRRGWRRRGSRKRQKTQKIQKTQKTQIEIAKVLCFHSQNYFWRVKKQRKPVKNQWFWLFLNALYEKTQIENAKT